MKLFDINIFTFSNDTNLTNIEKQISFLKLYKLCTSDI